MPKGKDWRWPCCSDLLQVLRAKGEWQQLFQPLDNVGAICFGQVDIPVCAKLEEEKEEPDEGEEGKNLHFFPKLLIYPFFFRFTGSIPLYCMSFGLAYQHYFPRGYFGLRSCVFTPPAESDPRAEPHNPLNINNPKMGCGCWDSCKGGK